jgi:hypothetical protein
MGSKRAAAGKHGNEEEDQGSVAPNSLACKTAMQGMQGKAVCHV